jgi:hypothetical protein
MRSRSVNVMFITFDGLTLLNHFCQLFEALTSAGNRRQVACNNPQNPKLYTKAAVKANPPGNRDSRQTRAAKEWILTATPRRWFHLA